MDAKSEPERACAKRIPADQFFFKYNFTFIDKTYITVAKF